MGKEIDKDIQGWIDELDYRMNPSSRPGACCLIKDRQEHIDLLKKIKDAQEQMGECRLWVKS